MNMMSAEAEIIREIERFNILTKYLVKLVKEDKYIDNEEMKTLLIMIGKMEGETTNE